MKMIKRFIHWLKDLRCSNCGKLLCQYEGVAVGKCGKCGITTRSK